MWVTSIDASFLHTKSEKCFKYFSFENNIKPSMLILNLLHVPFMKLIALIKQNI